jgi:hypothetical protein
LLKNQLLEQLSSTGNFGKLKMQLSEEEIKQIFFYCDEKSPNAIYADEVDIIQFAHKIAAYVAPILSMKEHQRCVQIVSDMNKEVGNALNNQRPKF